MLSRVFLLIRYVSDAYREESVEFSFEEIKRIFMVDVEL